MFNKGYNHFFQFFHFDCATPKLIAGKMAGIVYLLLLEY
jgi:hypothetical protein